MPQKRDSVILTGSSNPLLARAIAKKLRVKIAEPVSYFADGEIRVKIPENLRRKDVIIIQPTQPPADHLMELIAMTDAAKRASSSEIIAVIPYFGYSRQDRKDLPRVPITASAVTKILEAVGVNRIVTIDIHSEPQEGFFSGPWDNLYASYCLVPVLKKYKNMIVASPDKGGMAKATFFANLLNADGVAIVFKQRDLSRSNYSEALDMIGNVKNKNVLLVDDMIDTAGTICHAAHLLKDRGAKRIIVAATHGIFSPPAIDNIKESPIEEIYITDTLPLSNEVIKNKKITVVSVVKLLSEAIDCLESGRSLSEKLILRGQ